ncbi:MAG TPA: hypothetical protein V6D08_11205 [Candidatus Obscuribacterales bacterium]
MAQLLRQVNNIYWVSALRGGSLSPRVLQDLRTNDDTLSFFALEEGGGNLERIAFALAANRQRLDKFEYVVIDEEDVLELEIEIGATEGDTPDQTVNRSHRNLLVPTCEKLVGLAHLMARRGPSKTIQTNDIIRGVREGIANG